MRLRATFSVIFSVFLILSEAFAQPSQSSSTPPQSPAADPKDACHQSIAQLVVPLSQMTVGAQILGREKEIEALGDTLLRTRANNPAITGPDNVGKTSVVIGLQQAIEAGVLDPRVNQFQIVKLNWQPLAFDQQFEQNSVRLEGVSKERSLTNEQEIEARINELKREGKKLVLYIPEADILLGADSASTSSDSSLSGALAATPRQRTLANWLKRKIEAGEIQVIAELTKTKNMNRLGDIRDQFREHSISPMSETEEWTVLAAFAKRLEVAHGVKLGEDAIRTAQSLGRRYFAADGVPGGAMDLLETAAITASKNNNDRVASMSLVQRQIGRLKENLSVLSEDSKKSKFGMQLTGELEKLEKKLDLLERAYDAERPLMAKLHELRTNLATQESLMADTSRSLTERETSRRQIEKLKNSDIPAAEAALKAKQEQLKKENKEFESIFKLEVDSELLVQAASDKLKFNITFLDGDPQSMLKAFEAHLKSQVFGQDEAIQIVVDTVAQDLLGLPRKTPNKPRGVFMFAGPTGTGKDQLARAINDFFAPGTRFIPHPMNQIGSKHELAELKGAPPGYVGFSSEGGKLAKQARENPFGVIGFAEFEKMVGGILAPEFKSAANEFMQINEEGVINDGDGNHVSLRNNILVYTLNLGDNYEDLVRFVAPTDPELFKKLKVGESLFSNVDPSTGRLTPEAEKAMQIIARRVFGDPFIARLDGGIVIFQPLSNEAVAKIVSREIQEVQKSEFFSRWGLKVEADEATRKYFNDNAYSVSTGARGAKTFVQDAMIRPLLVAMREGKLVKGQTARYSFDAATNEIKLELVNP